MIKNFRLLLIILLLVSCKQQQRLSANASEQDNELLFSMSSSSCMGPCPVYEIALYADSTLVFKGEENTKLQGLNQKKLSAGEFDAFMGLIKMVKWNELNPRYVSDMSDLPSQEYYYNFEGNNIAVYKYGLEPKSLAELNRAILPFVYHDIFGMQKE
ncbi:hypothetical protein JKA74_17610 [Marivirga sp. S37H4]|uniref:DUF6438 domain-containing protein n=1 Tax=Marivirga aurantiaca TaxID=2802615 RepID=A0A934X1W6_9BACT|nr:DUF6438 domain-containing protein [Marivirga aurantiaca]MBK6266865.1 hypothetical protein [Marivirga aurantiaca]